jgi:hypothetical protein
MIPSESGTPPEIVHSTPVPAQVMHSNTFRRLTPAFRSLFVELLIVVLRDLSACLLVTGPTRDLFPDHGRVKISARTPKSEIGRRRRHRATGGLPDCCARAASGHAAAPPSSVMNARLLIQSPRRRARVVYLEY